MREPHSHSIAADPSLVALLLAWQSSGEEDRLESLISATRPLIHTLAARTLHRHGIHDPAAVDDVISGVFDHLRRLPGALANDRFVAEFTPRSVDDADDGLAYIVWLTRSRTIDVVRKHHRRHRHECCFSSLSGEVAGRLASCVEDGGGQGAGEQEPASCDRLHETIPLLEPRQRMVVELLLAGKSQVVIAHMLDICEGTVSRLRSKAIESLRRMLDV